MKNISIINVLLVLFAALILTSLSACQDEEFGWTEEEIATRTGFEKVFGKIDPNEDFDYYVKYLESVGLGLTRGTNTVTPVISTDSSKWAINDDVCKTATSMFKENTQYENTCEIAGTMTSNADTLTFSTVYYGGYYEQRMDYNFRFGIEIDGKRYPIFFSSQYKNQSNNAETNPKWSKTVTIPKNTTFRLYIEFKIDTGFPDYNTCIQCNGTGQRSDCTYCGGDGYIETQCSDCGGSGYTYSSTDCTHCTGGVCPTCSGNGYVSTKVVNGQQTTYYRYCPDCNPNYNSNSRNNQDNWDGKGRVPDNWTSDPDKAKATNGCKYCNGVGTVTTSTKCNTCSGNGYTSQTKCTHCTLTTCPYCKGNTKSDYRIIYSDQVICLLPDAGTWTDPTKKYYRIVAFEDQPYADVQDYNDYLVCISADKDPVASATKKRFMCEDLSDVSRETSWDFNDIVCDLQYNTQTKVTVSSNNSKTLTTYKSLDVAVQAVGGTYPIYLYLTDGTNTVKVGGDELHKVMSNTITQNSNKEFPPINVGASGGVTISSSNVYKNSYNATNLNMTYFSTALDDTDNSYIYAKAYIGSGDYTTDNDESHWRTITYQSAGEPARMIAVTSSTKWMKEDKPIYNGYPGFTSANNWSPDWTDPKNDVYEAETTTTSN